MTAAIEFEDVHKSYGDRLVLRGVDLTVPAGQIVALLGRNGAGKTTLISILATLARADRGHVRVFGADVAADPAAIHRLLSVTGQYAALDDVLTGAENLTMIARLVGHSPSSARRATARTLTRFGLEEVGRQRVSTYSGGLRRRLDLAASLLGTPRVVVLDEPTTGLDAPSRRTLWAEIRGLAADGLTVLLTTQYLEEADQLAHRVVVLEGGVIVADDSPAALKAGVGVDVLELRSADGTLLREEPSDGTAAGVSAALESARRDGLGAARVTVREPSLDEVFAQLTA